MLTTHRLSLLAACCVGALLCVSGCGSNTYGGGGYDPRFALLYGGWFGAWSTTGDGLNMARLSLTVDGYAQITLVEIDGAVELEADGVTPTTGTLSLVAGQSRIYAFELTNGWTGGFYADDAHDHAVLADGTGFGVLQKDAISLPTYEDADLRDAGFRGYAVDVDDDLLFLGSVDSQLDVFADGQFDGVLENGSTFVNVDATTVDLSDATFGVFGAAYDVTVGAGSTQATALWFLTPDMNFLGISALDNSVIGSSTPDDLQISVMLRD
jgi:hypothetical protein